jgi:RNA-directed DNA polymerase
MSANLSLFKQEKFSPMDLRRRYQRMFDNINHQWLLANVPMEKSILTQFLKAGFIYKHHLNPTKAGTPQGGIISPILANMTLDGIEKLVMAKYPKRCNNSAKVNFVRYADDFIVTANSEETAREIKDMIVSFLNERGLELSDDKTLISNINEGFDFLGWNFRKYNGKLLIKPSKKSIKRFTETISQTITKGKAWSQKVLISKLNPIIRGWSNYHNSVVSSDVFRTLDHRMWELLWQWLKEDIPTNPKIGLSTNTGKEALPESGISEQKRTGYCFYRKQEYIYTFL